MCGFMITLTSFVALWCRFPPEVRKHKEFRKRLISLMITLIKNYSDESKTQKRINVKKVVTLKEVVNSSFNEIKFKINSLVELKKLKILDKKDGKTKISFEITDKDNIYTFSLSEKRYIDNNLINKLNIRENIMID